MVSHDPKDPPSSRPSLRRRLYLWMALLAIASLCGSAMLVVLTHEMRLRTEQLADVLRDAQQLESIRIRLVWFERMRNLALLGHEQIPSVDDASVELRHELADLEHLYGQSNPEGIRHVVEAVRTYLQARIVAERSGKDAGTVALQVSPAFRDAVQACDQVIAASEAGAVADEKMVRRWDGITSMAGIAALVLLVIFVALALYFTQKSAFEPLFQLRNAIVRFGEGHHDVRLPLNAPQELTEVAATFNVMAEKIEHERERRLAFLAAVAHDMSNPLMAMKMTAGMVRLGRPITEQQYRELFDRVDRQVLRLTRMVEDLLDASRIEAGQLELRRASVDLRELVQESVELHRPLPPSHRLELHLTEMPVHVFADETRLTQVLNNLLSNAIKYSPDGGLIEVCCGIDQGFALLSVRDEGMGISPEDQARLFEPFRRARAVKELIPGVGLGLSVVRRIVTAHGGNIRVVSALGKGTTFEVRIPLAQVAADLETPAPMTH